MGKVRVSLDYSKVQQYIEVIKHYVKKIEDELDKAVVESEQREKDTVTEPV